MLLREVPDAVRAKLEPRRSIEGSARAPSTAKLETALRKIYASKAHAGWERTWTEIFEAGLAYPGEPELGPARAAAHALLGDFRVAALRAAPLEVLAVAERVVHHVSSLTLAPAIAEERSLAVAVDVFVRATQLGTDAPAGYTTAVRVVARPSRARFALFYVRGGPVRHLVCAAPEDAYSAARAAAAGHRAELGFPGRAEVAFLFPDEPWGGEDIETWLGDPRYAAEHVDVTALVTATTDAALVRRFVQARGAASFAAHALDMAAALPADEALSILSEMVPELLKRPSYGPVLKTPPREVVQALTCLDHPGVAGVLAPYATHTILGPMVVAFFRDHPEAAGVLEGAGRGKAKVGAIAARVRGREEERGQAAAAEELPPVLRAPPWRARRRKAAPPEVVADLAVQGLELERIESDGQPDDRRDASRPMTEEELGVWRAAIAAGKYAVADVDHRYHANRQQEEIAVPHDEGLRAWNDSGQCWLTRGPRAWILRHGFACLPGFLRRDWAGGWLSYDIGDEMTGALLSLVSPRTAPAVARLATRKASRRTALGWLTEHTEIAALGLVPPALGALGAPRVEAEDALLFLAGKGHGDVVRGAARRYGEAATRAVEALLGRDPLAIDRSVPKRPSFLKTAELPPVALRSGATLGDDAVEAVLDAFSLSPAEPVYAGVEQLREACDESLGAFALELCEQWVLGDAPGRHEWMLWAPVHVPSEAATRRIGALAREWARSNGAKAARACAALAALGSDLALLHLSHIAESTRFASLRSEAKDLLAEAARARGLSEDELGDLTVPDLGLAADGTLALSFGSRSFVVALDETLSPEVREQADGALGPKSSSLPRAQKTDDAALAKQARARFDALKKDAAAIADHQLRRLERAMAAGRSWPRAAFEERIARHPLLVHLARRLVWEIVDGAAFRVAEDGSYADVGDAALPLPAEARIRLAHPARGAGLAAWAVVFGDYEILQPFEQLGRAVFARESGEEKATELARAGGFSAAAKKVMGVLESRGWERDSAGLVMRYSKTARGLKGEALRVEWPLAPGISMEDLAYAPDQKLAGMVLESGKALGTLDEVSFSELVRDAEALGARDGSGSKR